MKTIKKIVVAVSLVVISAMAPTVEGQQVVEKVAPGTLVAPVDALNAMLNSTESQMISLVKAMPANKYGFAPSSLIFIPTQHTEFAGVRIFGALVIHVGQANYALGAVRYRRQEAYELAYLVMSCLAIAYLSANVYAIVKVRVFELARSRKHLLLYGVPFILWGSVILLGCKLMEIMRRFDDWAA